MKRPLVESAKKTTYYERVLLSFDLARENVQDDFVIVVPVYNDAGVEALITTFRTHIRPNDIILLVSGNFNVLNTNWITQSALRLKAVFPNTAIIAGTNGIHNLSLLANEVKGTPVEAIVYIYEPGSQNGKEFSWDFEGTVDNFNIARQVADKNNVYLISKVTGRPILQEGLSKYNWRYNILGQNLDYMFIQTQTYSKKGHKEFVRAINTLLAEYKSSDAVVNWLPQVSIDKNSQNGVDLKTAIRCVRTARAKGIAGAVVWWSPSQASDMEMFLKKFRGK